MKIVSPTKLDVSNPSIWPIYYKIFFWLLIVVGIFFVFKQLVLKPMQEQEESNNKNIQALEKKFTQYYQYKVDIEQYKKRSVDLIIQLGNLLKFLPNQSQMPQLIDNVAQSAADAGLNIQGFNPEKIRKSGDFYDIMPISFRTTTYFNNFARFAEKLIQLERVVNISNFSLNIEYKKNNQDNNFSSADNMLLVEGELQTYIYNQDILALMKDPSIGNLDAFIGIINKQK